MINNPLKSIKIIRLKSICLAEILTEKSIISINLMIVDCECKNDSIKRNENNRYITDSLIRIATSNIVLFVY